MVPCDSFERSLLSQKARLLPDASRTAIVVAAEF
jgi:hypothetical protein